MEIADSHRPANHQINDILDKELKNYFRNKTDLKGGDSPRMLTIKLWIKIPGRFVPCLTENNASSSWDKFSEITRIEIDDVSTQTNNGKNDNPCEGFEPYLSDIPSTPPTGTLINDILKSLSAEPTGPSPQEKDKTNKSNSKNNHAGKKNTFKSKRKRTMIPIVGSDEKYNAQAVTRNRVGVNKKAVDLPKNINEQRQNYHTSSCTVCKLTFSTAKTFRVHVKTHHKEDFICKICAEVLKSRLEYTHHMKIHNDVRTQKCDTCDRAFYDIYSLRKHMKTHSGEKPFSCTICEKSFTTKNYLEKHINLHKGIKACQCDVCGKTFSSTCNLANHVRIHTGEKPYTCDICGKSFTEKSSLRKHLKTHSGEKTHGCTQCDRTFRFKSTLVEHIRTHTGERPYTCDICPKSFKHYSSRMKHKRVHTRDTG